MNIYPNEASNSSQGSAKSMHKFGKTSTLDLMKFYEKSPQTNKRKYFTKQ